MVPPRYVLEMIETTPTAVARWRQFEMYSIAAPPWQFAVSSCVLYCTVSYLVLSRHTSRASGCCRRNAKGQITNDVASDSSSLLWREQSLQHSPGGAWAYVSAMTPHTLKPAVFLASPHSNSNPLCPLTRHRALTGPAPRRREAFPQTRISRRSSSPYPDNSLQ